MHYFDCEKKRFNFERETNKISSRPWILNRKLTAKNLPRKTNKFKVVKCNFCWKFCEKKILEKFWVKNWVAAFQLKNIIFFDSAKILFRFSTRKKKLKNLKKNTFEIKLLIAPFSFFSKFLQSKFLEKPHQDTNTQTQSLS